MKDYFLEGALKLLSNDARQTFSRENINAIIFLNNHKQERDAALQRVIEQIYMVNSLTNERRKRKETHAAADAAAAAVAAAAAEAAAAEAPPRYNDSFTEGQPPPYPNEIAETAL